VCRPVTNYGMMGNIREGRDEYMRVSGDVGVWNCSVSRDPRLACVGPTYMRSDLCKLAHTTVAIDLVSLECSGNARLLQYWFYNTPLQACLTPKPLRR
jgi:hypothetical protein